MIDLHTHILPGLDDGAGDIYDSIEMALLAKDSGTSVIVATPHCNIPGLYENYFGKEYCQTFQKTKEIFLGCQDIRRMGSAALAMASVACGRCDGSYELYLKPWDYAAGLLMVQEAGGVVTDFSGQFPDPTRPSAVLATNGRIHEELRAYLQDIADAKQV